MNTQSIIHNTNADLSYLADKALSGIGHSYMLKTRFGVGEGHSKYDYFAISTFQEEYECMRMALQRLVLKYEN